MVGCDCRGRVEERKSEEKRAAATDRGGGRGGGGRRGARTTTTTTTRKKRQVRNRTDLFHRSRRARNARERQRGWFASGESDFVLRVRGFELTQNRRGKKIRGGRGERRGRVARLGGGHILERRSIWRGVVEKRVWDCVRVRRER